MNDESLRGSIESAMKEVKEREVNNEETEEVNPVVEEKAEAPEKPEVEKTRDEKGKFVKKEDTPPPVKEIDPPKSWAEDKKARFKELPEDVRGYILQREDEVHKQFTKQDEERNFGKSLKDVIMPYMPIIQAEGGNPATAVQSLLNTAYLLRSGSPEQKRGLFQQLAKQYNVDISGIAQPTNEMQVDPYIKQLEDRLSRFEQNTIQQQQLQEQHERDKIMSEVQAFAVDPAHKYFDQVKPIMASLLGTGTAKDIQEAYDMACYASPEVRSTLVKEQEASKAQELEAKRKAEIEAKKRASVSVSGSPAKPIGNAAQSRDLREELREQLRAARGSKI